MRITFRQLAWLLTAIVPVPASAHPCTPRSETVAVPLVGFASPAELVRPPARTPTRGLLVLFPGSDVADMDGAIEGPSGAIISRPMRQVAYRLACSGFATLRYNKRYVTGPTTVDRAKFDVLNGTDFASDGQAALTFAKSRQGLATLPVGLVGWSEGTTVAMAVAAREPSVKAVVLIAPVIDTPARVAQAQYGRIGKPYLKRYATDDGLDAAAVARADAGPGGDLAHVFVRMFRGFQPGEKINPLLDTDHNGLISFTEADPIVASWYADGPNSGLGMASTERALKGVAEAFGSSTPRLLLLQGMNDSMIDPAAARGFAARPDARGRVKLITYPGLGHSLESAVSAQEDNLMPMANKPLIDAATWLQSALRN